MNTLRHDWGESAALFVVGIVFILTRNRYVIGPPGLTIALGVLLGVLIVASVFRGVVGNRPFNHLILGTATFTLALGMTLSLCKVVYLVVYQAATIEPIRLVESAVTIWVSNIVAFAIGYQWLGDRAFAFPRPEGEPADQPMAFLDYIFLSFTTSTAFSPTDSAPLMTRARMMMMAESLISLVTIAIVAARAINVLPQ